MPTTPKAIATAQRITEAAADLFFANGYGETTVAHVADNAGVAAGTVILHFGSKSALATAAFASRIATTVEAATRSLSGISMEADLTALVRPLFQWYADHAGVARDLLKEALFATGPWADFYADTVAKTVVSFTGIVERHRPEGEATLVGESMLAIYLLVVLQGLGGAFESVDHQVDHFLELIETTPR